MINLLSRAEQKKIYHEYLLRIATVVCFVIGIVGAVFIAILVPSYMRLTTEIASIKVELAAKQSQTTAEDQGQVSEAKEFVNEIQVLRSSGATSSPVAFIERIIALKPARVALTGFQYDISEGEGKLSIRGKADRREDLLELKTRLEKEAGFREIALPDQTLIKRTDIQFSMDLFGGGLGASAAVAPKRSVQNSNTLLP